MGAFGLLFRWSGRDLRVRWIQVAVIALVIALGTGSYAGLSSVTRWRRLSTDDGYARLNMFDLRVRLAEGAGVPRGELERAVRAELGDPGATVEERLVVSSQVDASTQGRAVLVPGELYGLDVAGGGPAVAGLFVTHGRSLEAGDAGQPVVLLERNFAQQFGLEPDRSIQVSGGVEVRSVGHALTPEFFVVLARQGGLAGAANFAAVFTSLETAQLLAGRGDEVNDAVVVLGEARDFDVLALALEASLPARLGGAGVTVVTRGEDPAFRLNDRDIEGDQQIYDIFAFLIFAGAVVAAFNLTTRMVEAQRREIGVAMVLGVSPARIAVRPLLIGAEIALLGVIFGIGVGWLIGLGMEPVLRRLQPLPEWRTPFQFRIFLLAGIAGFVVPVLASAWPAWRAVRVPPVRAIQAGYRSARGWGLAPLLASVPVPGGTFARIPVRNLLRAPRRAILTALGVSAAIAVLVSFVGLLDSFTNTIDRADEAALGMSPTRLDVDLAGFLPADAPVVSAVAGSPALAASDAGLRLGGFLLNEGEEIGIQLQLLDLEGRVWRPSLSRGALDLSGPSLIISELAASDLGLAPGDRVALLHPVVGEGGAVALLRSEFTVMGTHPHPFRFLAYMDIRFSGLFGLAGLVNWIQAVPRDGVNLDDAKRDLFPRPGVVSVQGVGEVTQTVREMLSEFTQVLQVVQGAVLLLALLIAFNSAAINMDERAREHATMFAFGVPVRMVLGMAVAESFLLGILATVIGFGGGFYLLDLILRTRIPDTVPDLHVAATLSPATVVTAIVLGVLAVALAPLLTWRRLSRMDVAASLKVFD